jgi:DHA1 family chloramphenicol resistance protein-like MFS transporter
MPLPVYLLALAVFAMGTSEFMLAGLVPDIAGELHVSLAQAGSLTSAFAVGMVLGAPVMAALSRSWPRRTSLTAFLVVFVAVHVLGARTDNFDLLLATRIVAAVMNAGFLAVAVTAATGLVAPDRKARVLAVLLGGTTIACVAGVPGGALLETVFGWRAAFWAVAVLCLPAIAGVLGSGVLGVPVGVVGRGRAVGGGEVDESATGPADRRRQVGLRAELAELGRPGLLVVLGLGALVNGATFCTFSYLAPVVTDTARLGPLWVPVVLAAFGIGSLAGVSAAGRLADRHPGAVLALGGGLLLAGWVALALTARWPSTLLGLAFLQGALAFGVGSTLISRALYRAPGAPTMAGSYATAAFNVGAAAGPAIGGLTLATPLGLAGPSWASAVLVAAALLVQLATGRAAAGGRQAPWPSP